jgi:four helix bundle protein
VFRCSKAFPKEERFSLTDQFRRAARSVGAQISKAWGQRRYEKRFVSKLSDADAEQKTQHWVGEGLDCGYLTPPLEATQLNCGLEDIGRVLSSMMEKPIAFVPRGPDYRLLITDH